MHSFFMETDEAIETLEMLARHLKIHGTSLEQSGLPLGPYLPVVSALGEDLELLAAGFQGQKRYSVTLHYPAVVAKSKDEAILEAYRGRDRGEHAIEVDGDDFPRDLWFASETS